MSSSLDDTAGYARLDGLGWLLLVPLLDEPLRFSLRGAPGGVLELLAETGDAKLPVQRRRTAEQPPTNLEAVILLNSKPPARAPSSAR